MLALKILLLLKKSIWQTKNSWRVEIIDAPSLFEAENSGAIMKEDSSWVDRIEENLIAVILGTMALLTFANVVARYVFNSNIFWALELTVFLFAWLVLLGATYAVKKTSHLGVDAIINMLGAKRRRFLALLVALVCIFYAFLMLQRIVGLLGPICKLTTNRRSVVSSRV